jgi:hypothetical protein
LRFLSFRPQFTEARRTLALAFHTAFSSSPFPGTSGAARSEGSASAAMMGAAAQLESLRDGCFTIDEGARARCGGGGAADDRPRPLAFSPRSTNGGRVQLAARLAFGWGHFDACGRLGVWSDTWAAARRCRALRWLLHPCVLHRACSPA